MPHLPWAVEVTRPSLQSLTLHLSDAVYYATFAAHGSVLHNPDDSFGIEPGKNGQGLYGANAYCELFVTTCPWLCDQSFYHEAVSVRSGNWQMNSNSVSLIGDYVVGYDHNDGR